MASLADQQEIVARFQQYLRINTAHPNPNYEEAVNFIMGQAHCIGLEVKRYEFVKDKTIVLVEWAGSDQTLPAILLNSHMDVAPFNTAHPEAHKWDCHHPPLGAVIDEDGKIYARGTQVMKSVGMQYLEAIRKIKRDDPRFKPLRSVYLLFVPDQEIGGADGVGKFVESEIFKNLNIAVVLDKGLPSPTESYRVFNGERIPWFLEIQAVGQPGHVAKLYDNSAMENLTKSTECIMRFRASQFHLLKAGFKNEGDVVSVNMVYLKAGTPTPDGFVVNQQPSEAAAGFDIRVPPSDDPEELLRLLAQEWAPPSLNMYSKLLRADEGIAREQLVTATKESNPWWGLLKNAVEEAGGLISEPEIFPASTDSWYFRKAGLPAIGFSPISNTRSLHHDDNEYLSRSEYLKGIDMYVSILKAYTLQISG